LTDGENGYLIPWKNTQLFAARLEQLLRDKDLARRLGSHAFDTVQRYDCCQQIDFLEQIFHKVAHLNDPASLPGKAFPQPSACL
jgi:glycosyltransferase involved in cell wall biosynthesis